MRAHPAADLLELRRVDGQGGVEALAVHLHVGLGAAAGVAHRRRVHRHPVRPLARAGLRHHDCRQRAAAAARITGVDAGEEHQAGHEDRGRLLLLLPVHFFGVGR